ncbi:flagellar biosynthesis protein FliQ [Salinicola endophyticus]|uniref:Flagellar biosynthetic protein FliQ n=1 Tax=Salinicola endophyticus TaxID=1949083 RepID=A0ABY8FJL8_9GAMM|nr:MULTISPECIES: flagellar biosynthesis protein FliQ [Salinicola]WFF42832.1 flagellar biosynthesis protein FliQ [Salinicola endophyticus]
MTPEMVMSLAYQGMKLTLMMAGPLLLTALLIGLLVSLFQAATQINEMTLSFIPKILGVFTALILSGSWLIQLLSNFTIELLTNIPQMVN